MSSQLPRMLSIWLRLMAAMWRAHLHLRMSQQWPCHSCVEGSLVLVLLVLQPSESLDIRHSKVEQADIMA